MDLFDFARDGNLDEILRILRCRPDLINYLDEHGLTLLSTAACYGHIDIILTSFDFGADPTIRDLSGRTALHWSIMKNFNEISSICIFKGPACIPMQDMNGCSPLILACREGHIDTVRSLLEHQAPINVQTTDGYTALHWAVERSHKDIVRLLLQKGAAKYLKKNDGDTALLMAAGQGDADIVSTLLESWVDLEVQGQRGDTALVRASAGGHVKVVQMLLRKGACADVRNKEGRTALDLAVDPDVRSVLLEVSPRSSTTPSFLRFETSSTKSDDNSAALESIRRELVEARAESDRLREDMFSMMSPLAQLESWKVQVAEAQAVVAKCTEDSRVASSELSVRNALIEKLQLEIEQLLSTQEAQTTELIALKQAVSEGTGHSRRAMMHEEECARVKSELATALERAATAEGTAQRWASELLVVKDQMSLMAVSREKQETTLLSEIVRVQSELDNALRRNTELDLLVDNLRKDLQDSREREKVSQIDIDRMSVHANQLQCSLTIATTAVQTNEKITGSKIADLTALTSKLSDQLATTNLELTATTSELAEVTRRKNERESSLSAQVVALQADVDALSSEVTKLTRSESDLSNQVRVLSEECVGLRLRNDALEGAEAALSGYLEQAKLAEDALDETRASAAQQVLESINARAENIHLRQELEAARRVLSEAEADLANIQEESAALAQQVASKTAAAAMSEAVARATQEELAALRSELAGVHIDLQTTRGRAMETAREVQLLQSGEELHRLETELNDQIMTSSMLRDEIGRLTADSVAWQQKFEAAEVREQEQVVVSENLRKEQDRYLEDLRHSQLRSAESDRQLAVLRSSVVQFEEESDRLHLMIRKKSQELDAAKTELIFLRNKSLRSVANHEYDSSLESFGR